MTYYIAMMTMLDEIYNNAHLPK